MKKFTVNRVIKVLIGTDFVFLSALGFVAPVFAVFIAQQVKGGSVEVVGFSAAIYWIMKSFLEIPIGRFLDKLKGERDDLYFLVGGYFIVALVHFGYLFITLPWHIYVLQAIFALGLAMSWPAWYAIFTRHVDKGREGFEWSLQDAGYGIGTGITGALGGIIVAVCGFKAVFVIAGLMALLGAFVPLFILKEFKLKKKRILGFLWRR